MYNQPTIGQSTAAGGAISTVKGMRDFQKFNFQALCLYKGNEDIVTVKYYLK